MLCPSARFPINIQFGMFYLVMLYIMRLVQRSESVWTQQHKNLVFWVSCGINGAFFIATVGWLIFCSCKDADTHSKTDSSVSLEPFLVCARVCRC